MPNKRQSRKVTLCLFDLFNVELFPKRYPRGPRSQEVGEELDLYLTLHCHHQTDFCNQMGSDESHFNVSLIVRR